MPKREILDKYREKQSKTIKKCYALSREHSPEYGNFKIVDVRAREIAWIAADYSVFAEK